MDRIDRFEIMDSMDRIDRFEIMDSMYQIDRVEIMNLTDPIDRLEITVKVILSKICPLDIDTSSVVWNLFLLKMIAKICFFECI